MALSSIKKQLIFLGMWNFKMENDLGYFNINSKSVLLYQNINFLGPLLQFILADKPIYSR